MALLSVVLMGSVKEAVSKQFSYSTKLYVKSLCFERRKILYMLFSFISLFQFYMYSRSGFEMNGIKIVSWYFNFISLLVFIVGRFLFKLGP